MNGWQEYDSAAEWSAARGLSGNEGDPLPLGLSDAAARLINDDPEAFQQRVRECAYARACRATDERYADGSPA